MQNDSNASPREQRAVEVFTRLFGERDESAPDPHPEFGRILRSVIFGEVFATGDLDDRTRELITVTALGTLQTLPQLKAHANAALNVGVTRDHADAPAGPGSCRNAAGLSETLPLFSQTLQVFRKRCRCFPVYCRRSRNAGLKPERCLT